MASGNAVIDGNDGKSLLAASSADGVTPVVVWANPITHSLLVENFAFSGSGAPSSTPTVLGQMYINTSNAKIYISTGTSSSADWTLIN